MRLISKGISASMLDVVQTYTLHLDGSTRCVITEVVFLADTRLEHLHVIVSAGADAPPWTPCGSERSDDGEDPVNPDYDGLDGDAGDDYDTSWNDCGEGCSDEDRSDGSGDEATSPGMLPVCQTGQDAHTVQLRLFLMVMRTAIQNVWRLELTLTAMDHRSADDVAQLMDLVVLATPSLQQLKVTGFVSRALLASFGASCTKLCNLEVSGGPTKLWQDLHSIMPGVTELGVREFHRPYSHVSKRAIASCLSQLSSTVLTHLNLGPFTPTLSMWNALPNRLKQLHCTLDGGIPDDVRVLDSLTHLTYLRTTRLGMPIHRANRFALRTLADILRLAPQLKSVTLVGEVDSAAPTPDIPHVMAECTRFTFKNLLLLHERVLAGLVVTSTLGPAAHGLHLHLWIEEGENAINVRSLQSRLARQGSLAEVTWSESLDLFA
ncbi:MAG: hypothetical protein WDW38_010599 [Sanguina aurantia]